MPATSNPVQGTPITEAALPLSKMRRVFDHGAHMMDLVHKRAEDTLDYFIDLLRWLEPDEIIIGCRAYTQTEQDVVLVVDRLHFAETGVVLWVKGGGDGQRYTVYCTVQTSLGKVKLFRFVMLTRGIAEDIDFPNPLLPTFSVADCIAVFIIDPLQPTFSVSNPVVIFTNDSAISLSTSALGFGEVTVDENGNGTVTVTNTGTDPLTISSVTTTGPFTLTGSALV